MRELSVAVVGLPYPNKDGSDRRFHLLLMQRGDPVELRPEPKNPFDEHAIAVFGHQGYCLGYVPSERAPFIGGQMRAGHDVQAVFQEHAEKIAVIRVRIGGGGPSLPPERKPPAEADFYPDAEGSEWGA